jgi:hypothetical protein
MVAAIAAYKAAHDTEAAQLRKVTAANVAHDARKRALIRKGLLKLKAPLEIKRGCGQSNRITLDALTAYQYQYGQVTGSFCGPATIEEISSSVPGPSPIGLSQWSIAAYMDGQGGNEINANGTNVDQETNGLNHYVGVPDYGWNFYGFVGMSYNPTSGDRSGFEANLASDVSNNSPVAGDAWEVAGGPHLVGHPVNQTIFHWFAIYGTSGSSTYYADSATTVWSGVPAFSWFSTYTLETILGGRGYIW